jgi:hypothetical protein
VARTGNRRVILVLLAFALMISLEKSGLYTFFSFVGIAIVALLAGLAADWLIARGRDAVAAHGRQLRLADGSHLCLPACRRYQHRGADAM